MTNSHSASPTAEAIQTWLVHQLSERLGIPRETVDVGAPFEAYALTSREALSLTGDLEQWLGRRLPATLVYEYPTVQAVARYLAGESPAVGGSEASAESTRRSEPVAIIGIGCRFPGAKDPAAFWRLLREGVDAIAEVPPDRWDVDAFYDPDPQKPRKMNTRWGGFLEQVDEFDREFFGISPREAEWMDPQQRILLEVAWEALEDAGLSPELLAGAAVGVFVGISTNDYGTLRRNDFSRVDAYTGIGNALSIAANRLSYFFDFRGPSLAVDTACSSSLAAVHLACNSLWNGESTLALAGGVNLILSPTVAINFSKAGAMAPDGRCKTFDARANGYVRSEGAGLVVLKPLSEALADGDAVYAVIRGTAVNQDGRTNGIMAPNPRAQEAVLRSAYRRAGVSPRDVQYVETHGTGTFLGDPIEATALGRVLGADRTPGSECRIGSVKTNLGHLEAAAGIAGLIKVALALKHREIPPSLHFRDPNPHIPFDELHLHVQTELSSWPAESHPALAGVSSFGFGGTNAHAVLEEAPQLQVIQPPEVKKNPRRAHLLTLSARSSQALHALAQAYRDLLKDTRAPTALDEICYSASVRRGHHDHRLAALVHSEEECDEQLAAFLQGEARPGLASGRRIPGTRPKPVFVFPGQGSQWIGMGRELLAQERVFRQALARCEQAMQPYVDWSLLEELSADDTRSRLGEIDVIQPLLFAIQVALAALWRAWGIEPDAVVGHSMGEVAAAYIAGALNLEDAAHVICLRSQLLKRLSGQGAMALVELPLEEAQHALSGYEDRLAIGASNSPQSTVLSGETTALQQVIGSLERQGIFCRLIKVDVAAHSPQVEPLQIELRQGLEGLRPQPPRVPIYSTVTGSPVEGLLDAAYWSQNLRQPVLFAPAVRQLLDHHHDVFLELSPHPVLIGSIQQALHHLRAEGRVLASLRRGEGERAVLLDSLGTLYTLGCSIDWRALYPDGGKAVSLPTYPWQRERCWIESQETDQLREPEGDATEDGSRQVRSETSARGAPAVETEASPAPPPEVKDWLYELRWQVRPRDAVSPSARPGSWLLFGDRQGIAQSTRALLDARGETCITVSPGRAFAILAPGHYELNPAEPDDFCRLLGELDAPCRGVVHLWSLDAAAPEATTHASLEAAQTLGCVSTLHLVQALAHTGWKEMPRLWLVTRGVHAIGADVKAASLAQSPIWGLGRTIAREHSEFHCTMIDLSPAAGAQEVESLFEELRCGDGEDQVALRAGARYVARLTRYAPEAAPETPCEMAAGEEVGFRLEQTRPGDLDSLSLRTTTRRAPGPGEVEIRVRAAGLNFLDVLSALDLRPDRPDGPLALGVECAGEVMALGEGVRDLKIGDAVIALAPFSFGRFVTTSAQLAALKPARLSFEEAAAIPIAFLTADYALRHLGRLEKAERVLIHAAAGGVGLAAVQLAQRIGAEIFATAGTPEKREFVQSMGIRHVADSRSLGFAEEVLQSTQGEGVDVVLNSLAGEFIPRGLSTLRSGGRFLEIGKRDIYANVSLGLQPFRNNLSFFGIDLNQLARTQPAKVGAQLREIVASFDTGAFQPLPLTVFPLSEVREAFRHMAEAKHIGKIVISLQDQAALMVLPPQTALAFGSDGTYLITGGLGGLGLTVAQWMVARGARHLVLMGRSGPSAEAEAALKMLRAAGAQITVAQADVAEEQQVTCVLDDVDRALPPLRGIVHAAGILDDGTLLQLNQERLRAVMAAKMTGAWNLHTLTVNKRLDFFVLFSSAAAVLGSPGQGNYAAANAFLDALAHHRRAQGLAALSINWGPWAEVGLAARPDRGGRLARQGIASIRPAQGTEALGRLLEQNPVQINVLPIDWSQWCRMDPTAGAQPLTAELVNERPTSEGDGKTMRASLLLTEPQKRQERLLTFLREEAGRVLRLSPTKVDVDAPLTNLGIDSLMAVELKNRVDRELGLTFPIVQVLQGPTIAQLAAQLLQQIAAAPPPPQNNGKIASLSQASAQELLMQLDDLSDEQVDSLLASRSAQEETVYDH